MTTQEVLDQSTIEGNVVFLPDIVLDRKQYCEVAKSLELIGGKWNRKAKGFVFPHDPSELLKRVNTGEKVNLKKEFQFFETPSDLADELVVMANVVMEHTILEPSAGRGAIIHAINRILPDKVVDCYELMDINHTFLSGVKTANILGMDFLKSDGQYDRIIANPPFTKNQDITHIQAMYEHLNVGGRLVSLASRHWLISSNRKETQFRSWLQEKGATTVDVPENTFPDTSIGTVIISIDK
jgi:predicted RNA methylase